VPVTIETRVIPVLNFHEKATHHLLCTAARDHGAHLLAKPRLADVIDADLLPGREKHYALMAHLDFVMVDAETSVPHFAVELDGSQHWSDPVVRARDRMKDRLCEAAELPLLRITNDFTRNEGRWRVLSYLVHAYYLSAAFYDAQEAGTIPNSEPFDIGSFLVRDEGGQLAFNTLDAAVRIMLIRHHEGGRLPAFCPDAWHSCNDEEGTVSTHAVLPVAADRYVIQKVRVRDFRFQGIGPSEIADQLAILGIGHLVTRWLDGEAVSVNGSELVRVTAEVQAAIDAGGFLGCASGGWPLPPGASIRISSSSLDRSPR
jgi:uncharacterized protein DUF2726